MVGVDKVKAAAARVTRGGRAGGRPIKDRKKPRRPPPPKQKTPAEKPPPPSRHHQENEGPGPREEAPARPSASSAVRVKSGESERGRPKKGGAQTPKPTHIIYLRSYAAFSFS